MITYASAERCHWTFYHACVTVMLDKPDDINMRQCRTSLQCFSPSCPGREGKQSNETGDHMAKFPCNRLFLSRRTIGRGSPGEEKEVAAHEWFLFSSGRTGIYLINKRWALTACPGNQGRGEKKMQCGLERSVVEAGSIQGDMDLGASIVGKQRRESVKRCVGGKGGGEEEAGSGR